MSRRWRRRIGGVTSSVAFSVGLGDKISCASWIVAGTLAYLFYYKPAQQLKLEQEEKAARAASDPYRYIQKTKPIPDPQLNRGLIYGNKSRASRSNKSQI